MKVDEFRLLWQLLLKPSLREISHDKDWYGMELLNERSATMTSILSSSLKKKKVLLMRPVCPGVQYGNLAPHKRYMRKAKKRSEENGENSVGLVIAGRYQTNIKVREKRKVEGNILTIKRKKRLGVIP